MLQDLTSSIPGIDEIISFAELMKQVEQMDYSTVVFDTAPTGHTLRLLSFPSTLEGAFGKLMALKNKFSGLMSQFGGMMGQPPGAEDALMGKLEQTRDTIEKVLTYLLGLVGSIIISFYFVFIWISPSFIGEGNEYV
jgi:arsenite-transporting ATPase